jgi:hypothetical protein
MQLMHLFLISIDFRKRYLSDFYFILFYVLMFQTNTPTLTVDNKKLSIIGTITGGRLRQHFNLLPFQHEIFTK